MRFLCSARPPLPSSTATLASAFPSIPRICRRGTALDPPPPRRTCLTPSRRRRRTALPLRLGRRSRSSWLPRRRRGPTPRSDAVLLSRCRRPAAPLRRRRPIRALQALRHRPLRRGKQGNRKRTYRLDRALLEFSNIGTHFRISSCKRECRMSCRGNLQAMEPYQ